jgi:hypothetical protein
MLRPQDEHDLIGLASGLGDTASDARARRILDADSKAPTYLAQVREVADALKYPPAEQVEPLSDETRDRLLSGAYGKWRNRRRKRFLVPAAMAAALLLAAIGLTLHQASIHTGSLKLYYEEMGAYARSSPDLRTREIRLHEPFQTPDNAPAAVALDEVRIVIEPGSRLTIHGKSRLVIDSGGVAVETPGQVTIECGDLAVRAEAADVQVSGSPGRFVCGLHHGHAKLSSGRVHAELLPGRQAFYDFAAGAFGFLDRPMVRGSWLDRGRLVLRNAKSSEE